MKRLAAITTLLVAGLFLFPSGAQAQPAPVSQFGFSDGTLIDTGSYTQLDRMAAVLGSTTGSFFRGAVHWAPTATAEYNQTTYDTAVLNTWQDGLTLLPEIHTSKQGGGGYIDPLTCTGPGCGTTNFENAVTDFATRYGPGGAFAQAHPGFPGITRYEVWNEPNTNTGTLNATNTNDTDPAEIDNILHAESVALVNAATSGGWLDKLQIACCALGNPGNGNHAYSLAYFKSMIAVPGNTVWQDINPAGAEPGAITVHLYYGQLNPTSCSDTGGDNSSAEKCPKFLEDYWHPYIAAGPDPQDGLGITEGGYSGPVTCSAANTVSEQAQSDDDAATINYYRSVPDINLEFLAYYKAEDTVASESGNCWQEGLGPVQDDGTWKPWATTYNQIVAADTQPPPPPANASDSYTRSVGTGWGTADTGGAYTQTTGVTGDLSVDGSEGVIVSSTGSTDTVTLPSMTPIDSQHDGIDATFPNLPGSGNETLIIEDRIDAAGDLYKATYQVWASGYVTVTIRARVSGTPDVVLATQTQFCKVQAGTPYHFELDATGLNPTSVYAGCYVATGSGKGITASDSTAQLQAAGGFALAENPSSGVPLPFEVDFDNLQVAP